jgi:hypothetical protein
MKKKNTNYLVRIDIEQIIEKQILKKIKGNERKKRTKVGQVHSRPKLSHL